LIESSRYQVSARVLLGLRRRVGPQPQHLLSGRLLITGVEATLYRSLRLSFLVHRY